MSKLSIITKNPFNIRYSVSNRWKNQLMPFEGFCRFTDYRSGIRAGIILLRNYMRLGYVSIHSIVNRFAPSSENDTDAYIEYLEYRVGIDRHASIEFGSFHFALLCVYMMRYESQYHCATSTIFAIITQFHIES